MKPALVAGFVALGSFFGSAIFFNSIVFKLPKAQQINHFKISITSKFFHPLKGEAGAIEGAKNNHDFGILNFPKGLSVFSSTKFVLKNSKLILPFLGAKEEANYGT